MPWRPAGGFQDSNACSQSPHDDEYRQWNQPNRLCDASHAAVERPSPARREFAMRVGGAGGIRTHEWRFCRPLPWATWVPRQTIEYSKSLVAEGLFTLSFEGPLPGHAVSANLQTAGHQIAANEPHQTTQRPHFLILACTKPLLCRDRRSYSRLAQKSRRLFRRRRVDVKACSPLKSSHLRQLRNDLDVPVIVIVDLFPDRRRMNHEVVRRFIQRRVQSHQRVFQHSRQARVNRALIVLIRRSVRLGQQPHFKWKPRSIRRHGNEMLVL